MKKITYIFFLIYNSFVFSQNHQIIENYISGKYSQNEVSKLKVSNERFQSIISLFMEEYYTYINQSLFDKIKSEFDFSKQIVSTSDTHNFSFNTNKRKFRKKRFSEPLISINGKLAIIYEQESCRQGLCGGGELILMENVNGKWKEKNVLYAFIG